MEELEELCKGHNLLKKENVTMTMILSNKAAFFAYMAAALGMIGETMF
jgi:hypothetical protein